MAFKRSKVSTIQEHNDKVITNEETNTMGCEIGRCNKKVAKKDLRESKECRPPTKEIWRWNETVLKVIIAKGNCHKTFYLRRIFGNFERY